MRKGFVAVKLRGRLSENIRKKAERAKIGINALGKAAKVSNSQLYDVLAGNKGASVDFISKLAGPLNCEPFQLLR